MSDDPKHDNDEDLEIEQEIHIEFEPYEERLAELGITLEAFEEALARAIDEYAETVESAAEDEEIPGFEEMPIHIGNQTFRVTELADVTVSSDYDEDDDFDDDDEEDFDDESE